MSQLSRSLRWFRRGLRLAAARPLVLGGLLLLELLPAVVLVLPARAGLAAALDHSLVGEVLRHGPTGAGLSLMARQAGGQPGLQGLAPFVAGELVAREHHIAGDASAGLAAALILFWLHGLASCGFLATLYPERPREQTQFAAAAAYYALPATGLSLLAAAGYLTAGWLGHDRGGLRILALAGEPTSETLALALRWGGLGAAAIGVLAVKLLFDLSRLEMVDRGTRNWPWVALLSLSRFLRQGPRFLGLYLLHGAALLALTLLWWMLPGRFWPQSWLGLGALFVLQQLFSLTRLGLRLGRLAAMRLQLRELTQRGEWPAYKIEPRGRELA